MIRFYLKIQNNMLTKNLLYIVTIIVVLFNAAIRISPKSFINFPAVSMYKEQGIRIVNIVPAALFTYCDEYLLVLFIILIFFYLGVDFSNSMEEIGLAVGGSKINKFMARKLVTILLLYFGLYIVSWANIYTLYVRALEGTEALIPLKQIILFSFSTNLFIISLSLLVLMITRDIAVSTSIITAYYLIEEALWRCKVTEKYGILGHIYQYEDYGQGQVYKFKLFYIIISVLILFVTYKISQRKINLRLIKGRKTAPVKM